MCAIASFGISDVIMGAMASQITRLTIVYSTVYSGADQRKHPSSASLAFVCGIHSWPVNSPHKWPVTRKMFSFDDVSMDTGHELMAASSKWRITHTTITIVKQIYRSQKGFISCWLSDRIWLIALRGWLILQVMHIRQASMMCRHGARGRDEYIHEWDQPILSTSSFTVICGLLSGLFHATAALTWRHDITTISDVCSTACSGQQQWNMIGHLWVEYIIDKVYICLLHNWWSVNSIPQKHTTHIKDKNCGNLSMLWRHHEIAWWHCDLNTRLEQNGRHLTDVIFM